MLKARFVRRLIIAVSLLVLAGKSSASVDDAIARAMEAISPYVKQGYLVRDDQWGGDLGVKQEQAITHTLFKGNDYWFCTGTDNESAKISIHVYDSRGRLVETDSWQHGRFAGAHLVAPATGTYYVIVEILSSPAERTHWAMVYGYK
ncbi:MAG: hypothetical protein JOZ08_01145 [Verrucomicrobia bacterium]|nr:hypothetical protein [Verrucomicrobiota bacterium]